MSTQNHNDRASGGEEITLAETEILPRQSIGSACVASLGGATIQAEVFEGMSLLALLSANGFSTSGSEQVTMNGMVVRKPDSTIVTPNAVIVIAGRVSNGTQ